MNNLIAQLDLYFGKKAPQLPAKAKDVLVKIAPYVFIIVAVIMLPSIFAVIGFSATFAPYAYYGYYHAGGAYWLVAILNIVVLVLYVMAIPGLFHRTAASWKRIFYATLVSAVGMLLALNIVSLIISLIVSFYFLFQLRPLYNGTMPATKA